MKIDVLVVGAGPVGMAMAMELARYGVSVRIVDKAAERTDKSKALVVWSRTLELFDRAGCTASFLEVGLKGRGTSITAGDKQIGHVLFDGVQTQYPFVLMIPQSETERLLEEHLKKLGIHVERSMELMQFITKPDGITSTLKRPDGSEETIESNWLIGCDGAHSTVRHQLGIEFSGYTMPSNWVLADLYLSGMVDADEITIAWSEEGVLALFPILHNRYRVIADVPMTKDGIAQTNPTLQEIQEILDRRGPGDLKASDPVWLSGFHINERMVKEYRTGRVFLAGDAAHVHSPAGGQGMNTGIQDACNLAWKLALVCKSPCKAELLLDSYSKERSAVAKQVLEAAGRSTDIAVMRGEWKQAIRNRVASMLFGLSKVRDVAANVLSELSIGYPNSPLNGNGKHMHGGPAEGDRAPIRSEESPVGSGDTPRFVLFADTDSGDATRFVTQYPELIEATVRKPFEAGGVWLVRPDGYVGLRTKEGDWSGVAAYLDRITEVAVHP